MPLHSDRGSSSSKDNLRAASDAHADSGTQRDSTGSAASMFAPAAPLARAAALAKEQYHATRAHLQDDVDVAEHLYADATQSPEEAHDGGTPVPEELDAEEAEGLLADEYRPLMSDEQRNHGAAGTSPGGSDEAGGQRDQGGHAWTWREGDGAETKARKLEVWLAQGIFFVRCFLLGTRSLSY